MKESTNTKMKMAKLGSCLLPLCKGVTRQVVFRPARPVG